VIYAVVLDVTVTVVNNITMVGVPVILNGVLALVLSFVSAKKGAAPDPSSFFALTVIVTPCAGITDVTKTVKGKSTWGAAG
jgi:hypothetical protein